MATQTVEIVPPVTVPAVVPVKVAGGTHKRDTSGLKPLRAGQKRIRKPALHVRAAEAIRGHYGETQGEIARCVLEGMRRKTIQAHVGRLLLERVLPQSRPVRLDLPRITGPADVIEAEEKILDAMNAGAISPAEARTLQAWAKAAYRARRIANADMGRR